MSLKINFCEKLYGNIVAPKERVPQKLTGKEPLIYNSEKKTIFQRRGKSLIKKKIRSIS